jgi:hypothetical protein
MRLFGGKSCKQQDEHATYEASQVATAGPPVFVNVLGISSVSSVAFTAASRPGKSGGRAKGAIMIHSAEPQ